MRKIIYLFIAAITLITSLNAAERKAAPIYVSGETQRHLVLVGAFGQNQAVREISHFLLDEIKKHHGIIPANNKIFLKRVELYLDDSHLLRNAHFGYAIGKPLEASYRCYHDHHKATSEKRPKSHHQ